MTPSPPRVKYLLASGFAVLLVLVELSDLLEESFLGLVHVGGRTRDRDHVILLTRRRHHDVDAVVVHHVTHRLAIATDDIAMILERHLPKEEEDEEGRGRRRRC